MTVMPLYQIIRRLVLPPIVLFYHPKGKLVTARLESHLGCPGMRACASSPQHESWYFVSLCGFEDFHSLSGGWEDGRGGGGGRRGGGGEVGFTQFGGVSTPQSRKTSGNFESLKQRWIEFEARAELAHGEECKVASQGAGAELPPLNYCTYNVFSEPSPERTQRMWTGTTLGDNDRNENSWNRTFHVPA